MKKLKSKRIWLLLLEMEKAALTSVLKLLFFLLLFICDTLVSLPKKCNFLNQMAIQLFQIQTLISNKKIHKITRKTRKTKKQ